jgi:hypothetical protein
MIDQLDQLVLTTAHAADCIRLQAQACAARIDVAAGPARP